MFSGCRSVTALDLRNFSAQNFDKVREAYFCCTAMSAARLKPQFEGKMVEKDDIIQNTPNFLPDPC